MLSGKNLLIRTDADSTLGYGHLMRSFALAQAWTGRGGKVSFLSGEIPPDLKQILKTAGMDVYDFRGQNGSRLDAEVTVNLVQKLAAEWLIADGRSFGGEYQKHCKDGSLKLLIADDSGASDHYYADIVLNRGLHGREEMYKNREPYTKLLLGHRFVSLRDEFMAWRDRPRTIASQVTNILVSFGGADHSRLLTKVVKSLKELGETYQTKIILGRASKREEVKGINIVSLINASNMADLMAWADIGVCGGGVTLAEMAFMGLPSIAVKTAPDQNSVQKYAGSYGITVFLGTAAEVTAGQIAAALGELSGDKLKRQQMSKKGRKLIDGAGNERIIKEMLSG
ncbi:MAG: UDP-2,4-diacetamido-2,4,6-trideoxy-beta-L-altropyranose hydrolase [Peptococcaceae bacterium]